MTDDRHDDLDQMVRRAARASVEAHRASIGNDETESALHAVRNVLDSSPVRAHRRRRWVVVSAAAALVALVGALVAVGGGRNDQHADVVPPSSDDSMAGIPTTEVATNAPATVVPTDVSAPSTAFDVDGNPLDGSLDDEVGVGRSAFVEVLHDYLLNRSDILGDSVAERERQLNEAGLRIHTTLDPDIQAATLAARDALPTNAAGFDAATVSIDTDSGAVRALSGASRSDNAGGPVNMAVTPRQIGSAVRLFITAAAIDTGVLGDDLIDNQLPCRFPSETLEADNVDVGSWISGPVGPVRDAVARAYQCGTIRLGHIVGLQTVVDTMYEMAASAYLDPTDANLDRAPLEPVPSLTTGAAALSALDMASGMQTIANDGVHHAPYFVEYIDDADGNRLYTHRSDGRRILDTDASLETVDVLEDVIEYGTGRRAALDGARPAVGVTGTLPDSTNAWFVGATPQLSTAVWVGDPNADTPMRAIREFVDAGLGNSVQGGHFPALIWKALTDTALAGTSPTDWEDPGVPARPAARLVLPGVDCLLGDPTGAGPPQPIDPQLPVTTVDPSTDIVPCP